MSELVKIYNPANASALTKEQLDKLQTLTSDEIKELAKAYPNTSMIRAYLLIVDKTKPPEKQLPALSSFENLWNLREKNGLRNYVAFRFKDNYKPAASTIRRGTTARRTEVLDLSEKELLSLPGFKTSDNQHPAQTVEVVKLHKHATGFIADPIKTSDEEHERLIKAANSLNEKPKGKPGPKPKIQTNTL